MLLLDKISVRYEKKPILNNISLAFKPARLNVLIGPNGTGKSSLLKAITGLIASSGQISVAGKVLATSAERSATIAYMQQDNDATSSLTVLEVVLLGRLTRLGLTVAKEFKDEALKILENFGILALAGQPLSTLSGGQRQLVYVAQCLFRQPAVLLLDEPTAALDLRHQLLVIDAVKKYCTQKKVIVIAAMHDLTLCARFAERVLCLTNGAIAADGTPEKVLTASMIEDIYGVRAYVKQNDGHVTIVPVSAINPN